ncbi:adhesion G protein-coupled receptor A3 isoform X1 [Centropristis striata]|uniref:adhesion G protein-coupled receptor A3 isoform X1 n=1 Tax=Centropristis striata TaxID=184440 RepID=UPI0027DFD70E|nr:adhesion G protein-coupled receptor A3 isoform X1 [Centropristis striata]
MRVDLVQLFVILLLGGGGGGSAVSSDCKSYDERPKSVGKVVCSNMELHQVLPPDSFPNRTVTLILNNNKIQELRNGSFFGLSALEKLDLRSNMISRIEPGAFLGLPALKRLDLSNNSIGCLNIDIFKGLTSLIRLNLSGNIFSSLAQGTFDSLVSLKSLEFQTPFLLCDCNLLWLLRWIKERGIVVKNTKCFFPQSLQGQHITSFRPELLTCDAPLELPSFQLTPSQRQVVFQGDSLPFQCQASFVAEDMQVLWYQNGRMVKPDAAQGIFIEKRMVQNCSLIASALTISNIQPDFTGNWECRVRTSRGNTTRTVHIVVLESSAEYCAPERVSNNKGEFKWPRTLAGIRAYLPCTRLSSSAGSYSGSSGEDQRAWRYCDRKGLWAEDDYSRCPFQKDVTRFLHVIYQMPLNESNVVARARRLLVYTIDAVNFSDKMDIIFVAEMIEKFSKFVEKFKDLGEVMVSMASNLMLADERVLWMAQREAMACSRIIACLQKIAVYRLATAQVFSLTSPNIALEAHAVRANDWNGMTCMLFQRPSPERIPGQDRQLTFKCNTTSSFSSILHKQSTIVEASLQLPQALFTQAAVPGQAEDTVYKLHLLGFRNGKFFPSTSNSSQLADGGKRRSVATPVIMAKIEGMSPRVLRTPVNITLRRFARGSDAVSACWNFSLAGGHGGWQSDGCRILGHHDNFTTISCNSLGNYGLLMDLSSVEFFSQSIQPLHPVIYATAIILLICLFTIIVSYIYHHRSVRVSRKFWHMLVNLCFHISLTCGVFVGGINQTRYASVCQAVGILLHYSTLATALWVGVTARNIYKQVTRKAKRYEELDEPPPPPRPMLRFYLIGGGIPIIVCGITAAANIKNYGSRTNAPYCWMAWEPSIGAFYGPVGFIIFVDCMYFLSILLQLRRHPERRYEFKEPTEEQQHLAPAHTEAGADGPSSHCHPLTLQLQPHEASSSLVSAPHTVPLSALENEHTFAAQLMGATGALGLYAALWVFGAMAVSQDHPFDLAFTCLFGVAALALGAFMVAHHCVNRQDMRRFWSQACCSGRRAYSAQEDVLLPQPGVALTSTAGSVSKADGESTKCGHSSADSSYTNKSAPSVRNSAHGSKLTNLHAEAAQCKSASAPVTANGAAVLDNSLTEHSIDNEIKMHVAPVEVQFRPVMNNINNPAAATNGHASRHHKNRARAHRASRLTVLREYAYDVPTSVEGSVQSAPHRRQHHYDVAARNSRRAAYMAYRERHQSQLQQDSSDSASLPRRSRYADKGGGSPMGNGSVVTEDTEQAGVTTAAGSSSSKDSGPVQQPSSTELESQPKSYGLNLITQNGGTLKENGQAVPLINTESAASIKTGLWKHETTV